MGSTSLLDVGADWTGTRNDRSRPLHLAAGNSESPAVVEVLLDAGADLEARIHGRRPVYLAVLDNDPAMIQLLLGAGADVEAEDAYYGWRPLHAAAANNGNPAVVQLLLDVGADLESRSHSLRRRPLHSAASNNQNPNPAALEALVTTGHPLRQSMETAACPWTWRPSPMRIVPCANSSSVRAGPELPGKQERGWASAQQEGQREAIAQQDDGVARGITALFGGAGIAIAGRRGRCESPDAIADAIGTFAGGILSGQPAGGGGGRGAKRRRHERAGEWAGHEPLGRIDARPGLPDPRLAEPCRRAEPRRELVWTERRFPARRLRATEMIVM